jgi:hypothetical protein
MMELTCWEADARVVSLDEIMKDTFEGQKFDVAGLCSRLIIAFWQAAGKERTLTTG